MTTEHEQLPDGIYFGLDFEAYHGQRRLSASGCCNMLVDPATFWADSWLNPDRVEIPTEARITGSAYHTAILEPERFAAEYRAEPDPRDYPDAIMTASEVMSILKELGEKQTIKGEDALARARRLDELLQHQLVAKRPIWEIIKAEWREADPDELQIGISRQLMNEIERDVQLIAGNPEILPHVRGGQAEVTILWTGEDGTRWKIRVDYLRPDGPRDLKSFANTSRKNLNRCIADAIQYNRYYVQAVLYLRGVEKIRELGKDLPIRKVQNQAQKDLITAIRESVEPFEFWWIFQQKGGIPNVLARKLRRNATVHNDRVMDAPDADKRESLRKKLSRPPSRIFEKGMMEIDHCARLFRQCSEIWPSGPWGSMIPVAEIDDEDFPPFFLES